MPMGPGAPSDVGPDGGLVDPGMVGPDGMPPGGDGPPPGEDAGPGDGPMDDAAGGEGDFPPEGDDDDATQGGPTKKGDPGKKQKKGSLRGIAVRRYNGLDGQPLTEEQLIRHLAVRASGAHPRVMALLRAEGRRRVTADRGEMMPYRTLSSGHQVHVGRTPSGWMGVISPPEPYTASPHLMDLGTGTRQDAHRLAEAHLSRGPARDFVRATSGDMGDPGMPVSTTVHSEWYRSPGTGGVRQEWRPAQASRGRRPFAVSRR